MFLHISWKVNQEGTYKKTLHKENIKSQYFECHTSSSLIQNIYNRNLKTLNIRKAPVKVKTVYEAIKTCGGKSKKKWPGTLKMKYLHKLIEMSQLFSKILKKITTVNTCFNFGGELGQVQIHSVSSKLPNGGWRI